MVITESTTAPKGFVFVEDIDGLNHLVMFPYGYIARKAVCGSRKALYPESYSELPPQEEICSRCLYLIEEVTKDLMKGMKENG